MKDPVSQEASHLPEGTREYTFLVYHAGSGQIVHGHRAFVLPSDKDSPSVAEIEKQAVRFAADATRHEPSALKTIAVQFDELEPGVVYRVDPQKCRLERQPSKPTSK